MQSKTLLELKTIDGYCIKNIFELFHININHGIYLITPECMKLVQSDKTDNIVYNLVLHGKHFVYYRYNHDQESFCISINQTKLRNLCKNIKRSDGVKISIVQKTINDKVIHMLVIVIEPKTSETQSTTSEMVIDVNTIFVDREDNYKYDQVIKISSSDFYKQIKDLMSLSSPTTTITSIIKPDKNIIKFSCSLPQMTSKMFQYDQDDMNRCVYYDRNVDISFSSDISNRFFDRIQKITRLGTSIEIYHSRDPAVDVCFEAKIGAKLGVLKVFIKKQNNGST